MSVTMAQVFSIIMGIVLGIAEIALPVDAAWKLPALAVAALILVVCMIATAVRIYRYAVGLVSWH